MGAVSRNEPSQTPDKRQAEKAGVSRLNIGTSEPKKAHGVQADPKKSHCRKQGQWQLIGNS